MSAPLSTDPYVAVDLALEPAERQDILETATRAWPRTEGAHVADLLDILDDSDGLLSLTEPEWAEGWPLALAEELENGHVAVLSGSPLAFAPLVVRGAILATILLGPEPRPPDREAVKRLARRACGVTP